MTTYVFPEFVRSLIAGDFVLAMYPMNTSIGNSFSMEPTAIIKAGPQIRIRPVYVSNRLELQMQGSILFQQVSLSVGQTYYLVFSLHTAYVPATKMLVENRLAYTSFTVAEAVSSDFFRFTYPDNLIAKI